MDVDLTLDIDEQHILDKFDTLVTNGTVIYSHDYRTVRVTDKGLTFEFRILKGMSQKPSYTNADGTYKTSEEVKSEPVTLTGCQPGSDINVAGYEVGTLGSGSNGHLLAFNKFPAARPHLLILTVDGYRRQFEELDGKDLWAMWTVMSRFNEYQLPAHRGLGVNDGRRARQPHRQRHISFFNCGLKSGCSRLHKHMQVFPILGEQELGRADDEGPGGEEFKLWPDIEDPAFYKEVLPFKVAIARFKDDGAGMTGDRLLETYRDLLEQAGTYLRDWLDKHGDGEGGNEVNVPGWAEQEHRDHEKLIQDQQEAKGATKGGPLATGEQAIPHNVILDRDWMVVIPRRAAGWRGGDSNAVSMLGMHWVSGEDKMNKWIELGPAEILRQVGVPNWE